MPEHKILGTYGDRYEGSHQGQHQDGKQQRALLAGADHWCFHVLSLPFADISNRFFPYFINFFPAQRISTRVQGMTGVGQMEGKTGISAYQAMWYQVGIALATDILFVPAITAARARQDAWLSLVPAFFREPAGLPGHTSGAAVSR
ncbi:MAG: hypothetical protein ACUVRC_07645 [Desulfotomaculales bacterium]